MDEAERKARENVDNPQNDQVKRQPQVGTCYAEDVIGQALYANKQAIEDAKYDGHNKKMLKHKR